MTTTEMYCSDVLEWARTYEGELAHAIITDPPYGLSDTPDMEDVLTHWLDSGEYEGTGSGFMSSSWDSFVPGPKVWAALRAHCHPGAYLFAFGGTRTADLLGVAIRLGGWEKFDEIALLWTYGSGFPKSLSIGRAIDKAAVIACPDCGGTGWILPVDEPVIEDGTLLDVAEAIIGLQVVCETCEGSGKVKGAEREVVGPRIFADGTQGRRTGGDFNGAPSNSIERTHVTVPATDLAKVWDNYGTAMKPSHEPVLCFRNPRVGTYAENCMETGAGALNIDGGRVVYQDQSDKDSVTPQGRCTAMSGRLAGKAEGELERSEFDRPERKGRWPANTIFSHSPGCKLVGMERVSGQSAHPHSRQSTNKVYGEWKTFYDNENNRHADPDGTETIPKWDCVEGCAVRALNESVGERKSGGSGKSHASSNSLFVGTGGNARDISDTGPASRFYFNADWSLDIAEQIESENPFLYCPKSSKSERNAGGATNNHPCCKPLTLTKYLATLLAPPPEYAPRRLLVPFSGSGSEIIGAILSGGWDHVIGIEQDQSYIDIANTRVRFWTTWKESGLDDPKTILKAAKKEGDNANPTTNQPTLL